MSEEEAAGDSTSLDVRRDRARGCLLLGAIGDALGAPVEFMDWAEIRRRFGPLGVTGFEPAYGRRGAITDDTQMTLFTAEGLIRALVRARHRGIVHVPSMIQRSYWRWLTTQDRAGPGQAAPPRGPEGWLMSVPELWSRRAPGNTCLSALRSGRTGTIDEPINDSKGCGGVMRTAPVGLTTAIDPFRLGAEAGALTHGHPSGYLPAGFLASAVAELFAGATLDGALDTATEQLRGYSGHAETLAAVARAREVASAGRPSVATIESLGGAWVGEEALAIAVLCALVADGPLDGVTLAANHSGDTDSTAAIAGNLLGVIHGAASIPPPWLDGLELAGVITRVADDLVDAFYGEGVGGEWEPIDARVRTWLDRYPGG